MSWKRRIFYVGLGFVAGMGLWVLAGVWLLWRHPPYHIPGPTGTNYRRWVVDSTVSIPPTGTVWRMRSLPGSGVVLAPETNGEIGQELPAPATNGGVGAVTP